MTLDFNLGLGKLLKAKREAAGLSVRDAAGKLGMSKTKIAYLEDGKNQTLTLEELHRISELYGLDGADVHRITTQLPARAIDGDMVALATSGHAEAVARMFAINPRPESAVPHIVVRELAEDMVEELPAIETWLSETRVPDALLFINPPAGLRKADAIRNCLRVAEPLQDDPTRYAKALAILDAAWRADSITGPALVAAIKEAADTLVPNREQAND